MPCKDTVSRFGWVTLLLHWGVAVAVIGLFALGVYMTRLDYYHPWYHAAPDLHRSLGVLTGMLILARLSWRLAGTRPPRLGARWERVLGAGVQGLFHVLLIVIVISGYLITTAEGQAVAVFQWFEIPARLSDMPQQADRAGAIHKYLAYLTILLVGVHVSASLKHHYIDKDATLTRMLGRPVHRDDPSNP
jgi:cytochrome b561